MGVSLHDLIALTEETLVLKAGSWMKLDLVLGGIPFVAYGERERLIMSRDVTRSAHKTTLLLGGWLERLYWGGVW